MPKIGYKQTKEHRKKISIVNTGKIVSKKTRHKMSLAKKGKDVISKYSVKELYEMILEIDKSDSNLQGWDLKFISGLVDNKRWEYSNKQQEHIIRIYDRVCR